MSDFTSPEPHVHTWKAWAYSSREADFCCSCGAKASRALTPEEGDQVLDQLFPASGGPHDVHRVYHDFVKTFLPNDEYRETGYALMEAVEAWAEQYPEVRVVGCDDNRHMSSDLVIIPHQSASRYMGATIVFIPQYGASPAEFFLYPGQAEPLREALEYLKELDAQPRSSRPEQPSDWLTYEETNGNPAVSE